MGICQSKRNSIKRNKNHNRQKMFRFGISFGRNDLNLEGHVQMGYHSKTIKIYDPVKKQTVVEEDLPLNIAESEQMPISLETGTAEE